MAEDIRIVERELGELALNMGPQHPSTHGVLHLTVHGGEVMKHAQRHRAAPDKRVACAARVAHADAARQTARRACTERAALPC